MKYPNRVSCGAAILMFGALSACASHNMRPATDSNSIEAAIDPSACGPSFASSSADGEALAPADAHPAPAEESATKAAQGASAAPESLDSEGKALPTPPSNAAALPVWSPPRAAYETDALRDQSRSTLLPTNQGSSELDRKITQQIRRAIGNDRSLSFRAKNVKIITLNGKVTLRGHVMTDAERVAVAAIAKRTAGAAQVESYLEIGK